MKKFYGDNLYWLVTVDGFVHGIFLLEADARALYESTNPVQADGGVELWRLNGGYLCTPAVARKTPEEASQPAGVLGTRSEVWEETHLIPLRMRFQREADGTVVMQLPGYQLPIVTVTGRDKGEAIALMDERMYAAAGIAGVDSVDGEQR